MKTKIFIAMILSWFIVANTCGQGQYWNINGNTGITSSNFLGPINSAPLIFRTSNTQRMTIDAGGYIGIGTASPLYRLDVAGLGFYDGIRLGNNFRLREYSANFGARTLEMYYDDATVAVNKLVLYGNTGAYLDFYVHDGKAKIGSAYTTPDARLEVVDGSDVQLQLTQTEDTKYASFRTTNQGNLRLNLSGPSNAGNGFMGINIATGQEPNNTLEITSSSISPKRSGLRFTNLKANSPTEPNPGSGVLAVSKKGDVIYVPRTYNCWDKDQDDFCDILQLSNPNNEDIDGNNVCDYRDCQAAAGDHDWYEVILNTPPDNNSDVMYNFARLGVGISNPAGQANQSYKLHLNHTSVLPPPTIPVRLKFSNSSSSNPLLGTGTGQNDGFDIGIDGSGIAEINQKEDKAIKFYTSNQFRAIILRNGRTGINTLFPNNRLEINSEPTDPKPSGLRFTDLHAGANPSNPDPNEFSPPAVLSVDDNGDVILVPDNGGFECWDINQNDYCEISGPYDEDVDNDGDCDLIDCIISAGGIGDYDWFATGGAFPSNPNDMINPIYHTGQSAVGADQYVSNITANVPSLTTQFNVMADLDWSIAGNFEKPGCNTWNIGVRGYAACADTSSQYITIGVLGETRNGATGWGGFFFGNVGSSGTIFSNGYSTPSDKLLKKDTMEFTGGLNIIRELNPVSFRYNGKARFDTTKKHFGVHAQDLLSSASYAVDTFWLPLESTDTFVSPILSIKNEAILYTSINAIKELDSATTFLSSPPAAPQLLAPSNGDVVVDTVSTSRFAWSSVKGAVLYHFQADIDSSFTPSKTLYDFVSIDTVSPMLSIRDTMIIYWRVRSKNGFGESPWSPTGYFTLISTVKTLPADSSRQQEPQGRLSDATLKQNVTPLVNSLANLQQLEGVTFTWDTVNNPYLPSADQLGMIAQQVQPYYPEVVFIDDSGYYRLDYERLVPVVVEAIKEQQNIIASQSLEIDSLKSAIAVIQQGGSDSLAAMVDTLRQQMVFITNCLANHPGFCNNANAKMGNPDTDGKNNGAENNFETQTLNHELSSPRAILYQNQPNPFGDGTVIRFFIPEKTVSAQMTFYDEFGRELKVIAITLRGNALVNLTTENLAAGVYTYSLIVNGEVVETMRMIRSK